MSPRTTEPGQSQPTSPKWGEGAGAQGRGLEVGGHLHSKAGFAWSAIFASRAASGVIQSGSPISRRTSIHDHDVVGAPSGTFSGDLIEAGYAALARGGWDDARAHFDAALVTSETAEALEGLSWAAWWQSDAEVTFDARERAYRAYRERGDVRGAARMATWLGTDHVDFRGEMAVALGWLARARRLLEGLEHGAEHGWLWIHEAEKALLVNDTGRARELAVDAALLGRDLALVGLEMTALATEGLTLVTEGQIDAGIGRLDEAAAAALSGDFREVWAGAWCFCYMLYACERMRDYDRAAQWCRRVEVWSERIGAEFLRPVCRAHYAGVLIWRGVWAEAEEELEQSALRFAEVRPHMAAEASVRLADLRRRQGRLDEAAELFETDLAHPLAVLGLGEVELDRGNAATARDLAHQYLRDAPMEVGTLRAAGLELLARAEAALGNAAGAGQAVDELEEVARQVGTDPLQASARFARGVVVAQAADLEAARTAFEDATRLFHRSGAPFEAARARLCLAGTLSRMGRATDGWREGRAASASFRRIGATSAADRAEAFAAEVHEGAVTAGPLTKRECEILTLVAEGRTNREIASQLVLSEHTINRHVTNILARLGAPSRSAAVAAALRRKLI